MKRTDFGNNIINITNENRLFRTLVDKSKLKLGNNIALLGGPLPIWNLVTLSRK